MHGKVERYSIKTKKHRGEFDPESGVKNKNPDPSRKIEI
jgi:nitrite reductase/ring-hydroxylating ferredoxin subunit